MPFRGALSQEARLRDGKRLGVRTAWLVDAETRRRRPRQRHSDRQRGGFSEN